MRIVFLADPVRSFAQGLAWYNLSAAWAKRWRNIMGNEAADRCDALAADYLVTVERQAEILLSVLAKDKSEAAKYLVVTIPAMLEQSKAFVASVEPLAEDGTVVPLPTGLGWWAEFVAKSVPAVKDFWKLVKACFWPAVTILLVNKVVPLYDNVMTFFSTEEEKAQKAARYVNEMESQRQRALANCNGDPSCLERMNQVFDALIPNTEECGWLDTMYGTALGALAGLGGGIIATDAAFKGAKVE